MRPASVVDDVSGEPAPQEPPRLRAVLRRDEVRRALEGGELRLHYLPVVDLTTGTIRGVEALVRWQHPERGLVMPDEFLPAVAHTPVMHEITRWVLDRACQQLRRWPDWSLSVNVSSRDVTDPDLEWMVTEALARNQLAPARLVLELTEQAIVSDLDQATTVLGRLRALGVGISLDDFGTGYSSLLYLRELPISEVKIDRVFVQSGTARPADEAIVKSVVRLGLSIGIGIVAEGVDTAGTAQRLRVLGCTAAQGFLWGRPRPAADVPLDATLAWRPEGGRRRPVRIRSRAQLSDRVAQRLQELLKAGASMTTIAAALNAEDLRTPHGTRWRAHTVAQAVASLEPDAP